MIFTSKICINNHVLYLCADEKHMLKVAFSPIVESLETAEENDVLRLAKKQLELYFQGRLKQFTVPYAVKSGTPFQRTVWHMLSSIPYGSCKTYKEIAALCGNIKACRAVGSACHTNPLPIIIPCHRVIGSNGKLTGYAGGTDFKKMLLELEKSSLP